MQNVQSFFGAKGEPLQIPQVPTDPTNALCAVTLDKRQIMGPNSKYQSNKQMFPNASRFTPPLLT